MIIDNCGKRLGRHFAATLALILLMSTVLGSCPQLTRAEGVVFTWTGTAGDKSWHTAGNWDRGQVPGDKDIVVIPTGATVNLSTSARVQLNCAGTLVLATGINLHLWAGSTLTAGKLDGAGNIEVSNEGGVLTWSGGTIEGTGALTVLAGGRLKASGSDNMVLSRRMVNNGTVAVEVPYGKSLTLTGGSTGTGDFTATGGRMIKFSAGTYEVGGKMDDLGNMASFLASNNATVTFNGAYDFQSTTVDAGSTVTWEHADTTVGLVSSSGNVVFNTDVAPWLVLNGGSVDGSGNISIAGTAASTWQDGEIKGTGNLIINSGSTLSLRGTGAKSLARNLVNNGTLEYWVGAGGYGALAVTGDANLGGGTLHINLLNSYKPLEGTEYPLLTCSSRTGEFSSVTSSSSDLSFTADYAAGGVTLTTVYIDTTPPVWATGYPRVEEVLTTQVSLLSQTNEKGAAYYVVLADGAVAPSSEQVKDRHDATNSVAAFSGGVILTANAERSWPISGLTAETSYDIYVVADDEDGNLQSAPVKLDVTTLPEVADTTAPSLNSFTPNGNVATPPTQLVLTFDEPVWGQASKAIHVRWNIGVITLTTDIYADSEQVTGDGTSTITVSIPAGTLFYGQQYHVLVDNGAFKDAAGNGYAGINSVTAWQFAVEPIWSADYPAVRDITQSIAKVTVKMIYPGTAYCVAVEPQEYAPTSLQVKEGKNRSGAIVPAGHSGQYVLEAGTEGIIGLENLVPGFEYDVFVVAEDSAGNLSNPVKLPLPAAMPPGTDFWNYRSPLPTVNGFWNVEYVNNRFAATGPEGALLFSNDDGQTWNPADTHTSFRLEGIAYGNGIYVLTANDGNDTSMLLTSIDAVNWRQLMTFPDTRITDVIFAADKFVAVADNGKILVSPDGLTWKTVVSGTDELLMSVVYGNGTFVAVGLDGGVTTSTDGETWTARNITAQSLWDVTFASNMFVAVGGDGGTSNAPCIYWSGDNGITWTGYTPSAYGSALRAILHDGTRFVALGFGSGGAYASNNGTSWTPLNTDSRPIHPVSSATYADSTIVAVGGWSGVSTSADGTNWDYRTVGTTDRLRSVVSNGSMFVAVGQTGTIQTSPDGVTWTQLSSVTTFELNMVRYLNNQFVAVGAGGKIFTSTDGVTWTARSSGYTYALTDVAYGGGRYVAVGQNGITLSSDDNGATWTRIDHCSEDINAISYGNGYFVALGDGGQVYRSNNAGTTWSEYSLGDNHPQDIIFVGGKFVAVGYDRAWTSTNNGVTWTYHDLNTNYLYSVAQGGGTLMAVGQNSTIVVSFNGGATWTRQEFPANLQMADLTLYGVAAGPDNFVIVGERGLTLQSQDFGFAGDLDALAVDVDKTALTFDVIKGSNVAENNITSALQLVSSGASGTTISWSAAPAGYINTSDGTVTRPTHAAGDISVLLTATITKGSASDTKAFSLTIKALELTADEAIALDLAALTWDVINGANVSQSQVTSNLVLPTAGPSGTTVSWTVDPADSGLDANTGAVTRPGHAQGDQTVTLTATVSRDGGTSQTKSFTITIKAQPAPYVPTPDPEPTSVITGVAQTSGDWMMDSSLIATGRATISLTAAGTSSTAISTAVLRRLAEHQLPITIITPDVTLVINPDALMVQQITEWAIGGAHLEIGIEEVTGDELAGMLARSEVENRNGRFTVAGRIYDLYALLKSTDTSGQTSTVALEQLEQQMQVTIDLSHLDELTEEQVGRLYAALLEDDIDSAPTSMRLDGMYDPATKSFTFSTDLVGRYAIMSVEPPALVVDLTIDNTLGYVNGLETVTDVPPSLIGDRTMVPIRFVAEAMGADVRWLPEVKTVRIELNGQIVELVIGQTDPQRGLDVAAQLVSGRTMVPLRFISESLGASVQWLPQTRGVEVIMFGTAID